MSERPEPAARKRPGKGDHLQHQGFFVQTDFRAPPDSPGGVCQWCNSARVSGVVNVYSSFASRKMLRAVLVVALLALVAASYAAWKSHWAEDFASRAAARFQLEER